MNWITVKEYEDITYKKCDGVARIAFNRPEVRNAFRPKTTAELLDAFKDAYEDVNIGAVLLSAEGPSPKDGVWSFCSGGDQKARGHQGYVGDDGYHRLNILEVQRLIRFMPKVVIAVVPGWAVGGGHSLHVVCDLTLASKEHAIFKQTDADVTSFDAGYGSAYLAKMVGQKKAREIFFLGRNYSAQEAFEMGMVNAVIPHDELEATAFQWAQEIMAKSPTSIKMLKFAMNLTDDGMVGQQVFAGEATRLAYMTDEAKEGRDAFLQKRKPNFEKDTIKFTLKEDAQGNKNPILPEGVKNYLIDIDGTVGEDIPNEEPERMATAEVFPDALAQVNKWYDDGHVIYFFTSRTEEHREVTELWLKKHGFKYHGIIFGKPRGGNYHWIDNHIVKATRYKGKFTDFILKEETVEVFND